MSAASPDCSNIDSASIHSGSVITEGAAMSGCIDSSSATEQLCYVHCNFCSTILAVSVPSSSLFKIVTVRCGHCNHLLSVNMMGATPPLEAGQIQNDYSRDSASSSASPTVSERTANSYAGNEAAKMFSSMPPEKRQRVPSVYNRFIKEEIQRIKAKNPDIRHKEAFSAAAKNWAHFPHIHFGLMLENNKQATMEKGNLREGTQIGTVKDGRMTTNLC